MTSDISVVAIGSNALLAQEMADAISLILGERVHIKTCLSQDLNGETAGDLFICNKTQVNAVLKIVPVEKILILNLTPTTQFFVEVAKIPAGETVHVLNNRISYALQLIELCKEMNIHHVHFEPIAYAEMDAARVNELIGAAKYIIGVDRLLNDKELFRDRYKAVLRPDAVVIGATRVAAVQSACALVKWFFLRMNKDISEQIGLLTDSINRTIKNQDMLNPEGDLPAIADEIKALTGESGKVTATMQEAILQSIMTQFNAAKAKKADSGGHIEDIQHLIGKMKDFR